MRGKVDYNVVFPLFFSKLSGH